MQFSTRKARLLIADQELSLDRLSKKADMPLITLSKVIKGKRNPTLRTIGKIAHGLGVDVIELIEQEEYH